jgi:hypothetical protein
MRQCVKRAPTHTHTHTHTHTSHIHKPHTHTPIAKKDAQHSGHTLNTQPHTHVQTASMLELQPGPGFKLMMLQKADKPLIGKSIVASNPNFAPAVQQAGKYVLIRR